LFHQRKAYKERAYANTDIGNLIDLWTEYPNYGKVSEYGKPLVVRSEKLKQLRYASDDQTLFALNFVADAWSSLVERMIELKNKGQVATSSPFYKIRAHTGYISLGAIYDKHIKENLYIPMSEMYLSGRRKRKADSFNGFMGVASTLFRHIASESPITRCGFIESNLAPIGTSGLVIEIAPPEGHSEDYGKSDTYIDDETFEVFAAFAAQEGFYIDKNAPWRLVANLNSDAMRKHIATYDSPEYVLYDGVFYDYAHHLDMNSLKHYLYGMYQAFQEANPYVFGSKQNCQGDTVPVSYERLPTTFADEFGTEVSSGNYGPKWSLMNYYHLRLLERGEVRPAQHHSSALRDILDTYLATDYETALDYLQQEYIGPPK